MRLAHMLVVAAATLALGCGHTDEEMADKQREIDKLAAELKAAKTQMASDQAKFHDSQAQIESLRAQLKQAGITEGKMQQALSEYKLRADQLAAIEARYRDLKARLEKLTQVGLKVAVRNNRMVIQLPGDVLFDSGKDELKPQGKEVLLQVADVVGKDNDLSKRMFQVAGHTDNQKYAGPFRDNWGLSLARSHRVLGFLITPPKPSKDGKKNDGGGGLNPKNWSASGYGESDPIAGSVETQANDDKQKNRRVELVLQPNVEEMLNLGTLK